MAVKTVLSCIQPTGDMHFGNYFGAVKNWVDIQQHYHCYYGVVDYHAMTMPYQPNQLQENTWELIFNLIAAGVKTENLFIQSLVPEHAELSWILNCFASYGQLTRMTQFKDKTQQVEEGNADGFISAGLLDYPVLQAADILIYKADFVPVGKDQEQHLELTRNIAQRFNHQVGQEYFVLPEPLFTETPKVMSPSDPFKKMSKSAGEKHYIPVFSTPEKIKKQIRTAVTDTGDTPAGQMSQGLTNLFELLKAADKFEQYDALMADYQTGVLKYVHLKDMVAEALSEISVKMMEQRDQLNGRKEEVKEIIRNSSSEIRKVAQKTINEVKDLAGLMRVN